MLQVHDIRQTRVYQEAKEEGRKEGLEQGMERGIEEERQRNAQEKLRLIAKMAALKMSAETIADLLGLDLDLVRKEMAKNAT
jgi:predicted transposase/invertase (TIGR01784 family)